jgi:hypothetical protein
MEMRCCQSTPGSPEYILWVTHPTSSSPVSPHYHCRYLTIYVEAVIEVVWICTWMLGSSELRATHGVRDRSSPEIHWDAVIE